jgi:hypothetical protein
MMIGAAGPAASLRAVTVVVGVVVIVVVVGLSAFFL